MVAWVDVSMAGVELAHQLELPASKRGPRNRCGWDTRVTDRTGSDRRSAVSRRRAGRSPRGRPCQPTG